MLRAVVLFLTAVLSCGLFAAEHADYAEGMTAASKDVRLIPSNRDYFEIGFSSSEYDFSGSPSVSLDDEGYFPLVLNPETLKAEGEIYVYWFYGTDEAFAVTISCTDLHDDAGNSIALFAEVGTHTASSNGKSPELFYREEGGNYIIGSSVDADNLVHIYTESVEGKPSGVYRGNVILEVKAG